jgi:hypothetical protein
LFSVACLSATSWWQVIAIIFLSNSFEIFGDVIHAHKLDAFWRKNLYRMKEDSEYKKLKKLFSRYHKSPIISLLILSFTMYNFSFLTPLVKKYNLHFYNFWLPRTIIGFTNSTLFASMYYIIGSNLDKLNTTTLNLLLVIFCFIILLIIFNFIRSIYEVKTFSKKTTQ